MFCTALLSACGANDSPVVQTEFKHAARQASISAPVTQFYPSVQTLYLANFGRPADTGGLGFFAGQLHSLSAPSDLMPLALAYRPGSALAAIVDAFELSVEGQPSRDAPDEQFIRSVYANLFNREPDSGGANFWRNGLESGAILRPQVALAIAASALGRDALVLKKKLNISADFTAALVSEVQRAAFSGTSVNAMVRASMSLIDEGTHEQSFIIETLAAVERGAPALIFQDVRQVLTQRCVVCHSSTPTYPGFYTAPLGIRYDTDEQIKGDVRRIYTNVYQTQFMPYGNRTNMTPAERELVRAWFYVNG